MYKLILSFAIIFSTIVATGQDSLYMSESIEKWQNSMEYTLEVANLMAEQDYDFRPSDEEMTFGQQLQHMSKNMTWLSQTYLYEDSIFVNNEVFSKELTPAEVLMLIQQSYQDAMVALKSIDLTTLGKSKEFFAGPKTKRQIISLMHDHATHHRAQLLVYLRMKNIKPPKYRGW